MKIFLISQIIKSTPIVHEALRQGLDIQIIHTGQHYDRTLSQVFFEKLSFPEPLANLGVGSATTIQFKSAILILKIS